MGCTSATIWNKSKRAFKIPLLALGVMFLRVKWKNKVSFYHSQNLLLHSSLTILQKLKFQACSKRLKQNRPGGNKNPIEYQEILTGKDQAKWVIPEEPQKSLHMILCSSFQSSISALARSKAPALECWIFIIKLIC
jgi:hypothetical protein